MSEWSRILAAIAGSVEASPDVQDLLDALWLAGVGVLAAAPSAGSATYRDVARPSGKHQQGDGDASDRPAMGEALPVHAENTTHTGRTTRVRLPAASPLAGSRSLARALRPLRHRVAVPGAAVLDVEATAVAIAAGQPWSLKFRPRRERAWALQIIVDEGGAWPVLGC